MHLDFLKELNRRLLFINKNERKKFLNKYDEIICCKMESGITKEDAAADFKNTKLIAEEILDLYAVSEKSPSISGMKIINKIYPVVDILIILFSYILTCYIYFKCDLLDISPNFPPLSLYFLIMIFVIPCFFLLYLLFGLYNINYIRSIALSVRSLIFSNIVGFVVINILLYLFSLISFSRIFIILFVFINFIMLIIVRTSLYLYSGISFSNE